MELQVCTRCVIDSKVPGVRFDGAGVCNYCEIHDKLEKQWPKGAEGQRIVDAVVADIKARGKGKPYDCIVGVSGGTDSTYLLYWAVKNGLRPLAVHFDNGWDTETAVSNIKNSLSALNVDLQTYVVDWEEFKDLQKAFLKSSLPWADIPTDHGIKTTLYNVAIEEGIKYVLNGSAFRSEGKMPAEWTYADGRMLKYIHKRFAEKKMKSFKRLGGLQFLYNETIRGIKGLRPLNLTDYRKDEARELLTREVGWKYYGGHHHENVYTRFCYCTYLPKKFGIDKRIITHSALVRSGEMTREEAIEDLKIPAASEAQTKEDIDYVIKKLDLGQAQFDEIMAAPPKTFHDYPSYYPMFLKFSPAMKLLFKVVLGWTPPFLHELESRRRAPAALAAAEEGATAK